MLTRIAVEYDQTGGGRMSPLIRAILDYAARYKFHICMYVCM